MGAGTLIRHLMDVGLDFDGARSCLAVATENLIAAVDRTRDQSSRRIGPHVELLRDDGKSVPLRSRPSALCRRAPRQTPPHRPR